MVKLKETIFLRKTKLETFNLNHQQLIINASDRQDKNKIQPFLHDIFSDILTNDILM